MRTGNSRQITILSAKMNYYEILSSNQTDSVEDIKKKYQSLLLRYHPDKAATPSAQNNDENIQFQHIDEAWKILRDPEAKKKYDAELNQHKFNEKPIVHEVLLLSEFDIDNINEVYHHLCRCGGSFVCSFDELNSELLNDDELFICCDECSLVIQLLKTPQ